MCKSQFTITRLYLTSSLSALLGLATFLTPTPKAHAACGTGEGGTLGVDNLGPVHIGDTITVNLVDLANLPTSFKATNFNTFVVFPDNSARQANSIPFIQAGATCAAGGSPFDLQCPGGGANCVSFVNAYVVSFADVGRNLTFSRTVGNFTAVCNSGGIPNFIQFEEAGAGAAISGGTATDTAGTPVGAASVCQTLQVLVIFPCITITKDCDNACTPYGQPIFFHGTVSNTGDTPLVNVVVTDTPPAGSTESAITFENVQPSNRVWDGTLAAGESAVYHGSYTPPSTGGASLCGPFTDTISATAVDISGTPLDNTTPCINPTTGVSTGTRPPVTATCLVCNNPCVQVTKNCGPPIIDLATGSYTVSGLVTNCGNVPLVNVVVTDTITNGNGVVSTVTIPLGNLDIGASVAIPPQTISLTVCGPSSDFFTATAAGQCGGLLTNVSATCVTLVTNTACIQVSKVCGPATIDLAAGSYTVSGSVTNCGTADLSNVVVTDTITNANGTVDTITINIGTVPAHTAVPIPAQTINLTTCGTISDFFSATGTGPCGPASATSATCATVVTNAACVQVIKDCGPALLDLASGSYTVSGSVSNCSSAPLTGVVVTDTITNSSGVVFTVPINIGTVPAHTAVPIPAQTITVTNCGPSSDFFTVTGEGPCGPTSNTSGTCVTLVTNTACIQVSKVCGPATIDLSAGSYTVSGSVTNCGTADLTGVVVTDTITNANGTVDTITIQIGTVAAHTAVPIPPQTINLTTCGTISDFFTATGNGPCGPASNTSGTCVTIVGNTACIQVSKVCGPATIDLAAGSYTVSGSVTNCGSADITGVVVTDTITNANGTVDTITINIGTVPAHTAVPIPAQTINLTTCGTVSDFFTATGNGPCGPTSATSATCLTVVTNVACIQVGKVCGPQTVNLSAGSFQVSGSVTNCGTAPLTGVTILDVVTAPDGTITTNVVSSGGTLPAGASAAIGPITIPVTLCGPYTDYLIAIGAGPCGSITNRSPQTCTTTVLCPVPCISVNKGIVCAPASGAACDGTLTYGETASGVVGPTNQTAFCYQIIVSNCDTPGGASSEPLVVTNIHDNLISPLAGFETPFTLQPGESRTNYYKQSYGAGTHVNTVSAIGSGQTSGIVTNAQDSTTATVVPISVACDLHLTSEFQVNSNAVSGCDVQLAAGSSNAAVQVTLTIRNTGQGDLNVSVVGGSILSTTPLVDCGTGASIAPPVVFVPAGQTVVTNIGCVTVSCPAGATISATVQGTAVASASIPCVFDTAGHAITTATSSCQNCVNCAQPAVPLECRVTGGGTLYDGVTDNNCVTLTTVLFDSEQCAGTVLDHISHGGQLGAPFNQRDCGEILADPCIRGEWEHNRHYQGTGSPKDTIDTKFHSYQANKGPIKGVFDSLECACLGCCFDGEFRGSATNNALCNPTDHKICGPEPRPAPANAIIFSGLGVFQPAACGASGKNQPLRWFVFRVYIEDRSEPGGLHPGGAKEPADVYCFQAWDTGITVTKHSDASTVATTFRQCLAADNCAFIESISTSSNTGVPPGTLPSPTVCGASADINDCGPLYSGNQQIHPSTGATCTTTTPLRVISP